MYAKLIKHNVDLRDVILNACDVVTIAVPPALPAAMTIGTFLTPKPST